MTKVFGFAVVLAGLLAIAACESTQSVSLEQAVAEGTMVRMTTEEIRTAITGNSEGWPGKGAAYYREDGTLLGIWKGDEAQGTWWVEDDVRCYDVEEWGGEWCHEFYLRGDEIVLSRQGTGGIGSNRIEPGNQLPQ